MQEGVGYGYVYFYDKFTRYRYLPILSVITVVVNLVYLVFVEFRKLETNR
jgi:hypothetical protein